MLPLLYINWDPKPEIFTLPWIGLPILWYGVLFAAGFAIGFPIFVSILSRYFAALPEFHKSSFEEIKKKAYQIGDKLTIYLVIGTVLGARIGHFLFYEKPSDYLTDIGQIFRVWEGGLASHGGAIGIILAAGLFSLKTKKEGLTWVRLLDFLSVPAAFASFCIRIGNFFNQEILGTPTTVPWAIIFGHPADRSLPIPRHPAQLYEAFFYILVFFLLFRLSYSPKFLFVKGRLVGLFLILVFGFRFLIEYFKLEQSHLLSLTSTLTMGQILSIPAILAGFLLLFWKRRKV